MPALIFYGIKIPLEEKPQGVFDYIDYRKESEM